jgi:hypothetical protein
MKHIAKAATFVSVNAARRYWLSHVTVMPKGIWYLKPGILRIAVDVCNVK